MPKHAVQPPEWIDAAPIQVTETVEIEAPAASVWARIADHESWPEWFHALERVERTGTGEGVGSGRTIYVMKLPIVEEFTVWDVDQHFAFGVTASKIVFLRTLAESVRLEPTPTGTRVIYRQGVLGRPGFGWAMALVWKRSARQLADALPNLKRLVEADVN